jgi:metal-sulfur cluster biosynthetic enzyme
VKAFETDVRTALGAVFDPCSVNANAALSIVDMGMVTSIVTDDAGFVAVKIRPTSIMCTLIASVLEAAEKAILAVPGAKEIDVRIDTESEWSESEMTAEGRRLLRERRDQSRLAVPIHPQQWKGRLRPARPI